MTRTRWYLTTTAAVALAAGFYASAMAQSGGTYEPWRNPDASSAPRATTSQHRTYNRYDKDINSLIKDLEELIRVGRRDRAADPRFLDDMEDRISIYQGSAVGTEQGNVDQRPESTQYSEVIFSDDFSPGNQSNSPNWQVVQTGWFIDNTEGLRSNVLAGRPNTSVDDQPNLIDDLFSSKKKRRKKKRKREEARRNAQPLAAEISELQLKENIPNNFVVNIEFKDFGGAGNLTAFLYQQGSKQVGYRLEMRDGGSSTVVTLYLVGSRSTRQIAQRVVRSYRSSGQVPSHQIRWSRVDSRRIGVNLDGKSLFTVTDRSFRDDWNGFSLINTHGDFAVRSIEVKNNSR